MKSILKQNGAGSKNFSHHPANSSKIVDFMKSMFSIKYFILTLGLIAITCSILKAQEAIRCEGRASGHLQGFDSDGEFIYWSMFNKLIKTDYTGKVATEITVAPHHGDCCVHDGKVYVAADMRQSEKRGNFVTVYNCKDLSFVNEYFIDLGNAGASGIDGITYFNGHFYIGEGKHPSSTQEFNWIHKFTSDFKFVEKIKIPGKTLYGIQAMTYAYGYFWLSTYRENNLKSQSTIQCDEKLNIVGYHPIYTAVGVFKLPKSSKGEIRLMLARNIRLNTPNYYWTADCVPAVLKNGLLEFEK